MSVCILRAALARILTAPAGSTPRIETRDEGDGVQTVIEYRTNADGKQVKVTRRIKRTLVKTRVNEDVAMRKGWAKFGAEKGAESGPHSGTTSIGANVQIKLTAGASKTEPEPDPTQAMREKLANKRVQCRYCKGDHYTARCPYRDTLEAIPGAGSETPEGGDAAGDEPERGRGRGEPARPLPPLRPCYPCVHRPRPRDGSVQGFRLCQLRGPGICGPGPAEAGWLPLQQPDSQLPVVAAEGRAAKLDVCSSMWDPLYQIDSYYPKWTGARRYQRYVKNLAV